LIAGTQCTQSKIPLPRILVPRIEIMAAILSATARDTR